MPLQPDDDFLMDPEQIDLVLEQAIQDFDVEVQPLPAQQEGV
jgi:hypothetical protein